MTATTHHRAPEAPLTYESDQSAAELAPADAAKARFGATKHRATEHGLHCPEWCEDGPHCTGVDCGESPGTLHFVTGAGYGLLGVARALVGSRPMTAISYSGRTVGSDQIETEVEFFFTPEQSMELIGLLLGSLPAYTDTRSIGEALGLAIHAA